jgi:hypothetical protein
VCVPAELDDVVSALNIDRFKCYRARGERGTRFNRQTVAVADAFESKLTRVIKPRQICTAVEMEGASVLDPAGALACYRIKDEPGQGKLARQDVGIDDELSSRTETLIKPSTLCVPSIVTVP